MFFVIKCRSTFSRAICTWVRLEKGRFDRVLFSEMIKIKYLLHNVVIPSSTWSTVKFFALISRTLDRFYLKYLHWYMCTINTRRVNKCTYKRIPFEKYFMPRVLITVCKRFLVVGINPNFTFIYVQFLCYIYFVIINYYFEVIFRLWMIGQVEYHNYFFSERVLKIQKYIGQFISTDRDIED